MHRKTPSPDYSPGGPALLGVSFGLKAVSVALGWLAPAAKVILLIGHYTGITAAAQWLWNTAVAAGTRYAIGTRIALAAMAVQQWLYQGAVVAATAAQWLWNAAMLANPVGLVIIGVVALIAALAALWYWWDDIAAAATTSIDLVMRAIGGMVDWLFGLDLAGAGLAMMQTLVNGIVSGEGLGRRSRHRRAQRGPRPVAVL